MRSSGIPLLTAAVVINSLAPPGSSVTLVDPPHSGDWPSYWEREISRASIRMVAFEEVRLEMEALIAAGELHQAHAKLPVAIEKARAVNEFIIARLWKDWLNVMGEERLAAAEGLISRGEIADGLLEFQSISVLRLLPVSELATARLNEARRDPAFHTALVEANAAQTFQPAEDLLWKGDELVADAEERARAEEAEALSLEDQYFPRIELVEPYMFEPIPGPPVPRERKAAWALDDDERLELFDALEETRSQFPETRAGLKARWTLDVLESDHRLVETVTRHRSEVAAAAILKDARFYLANNQKETAVNLLETIMREHPDSQAAEGAREQLRQIE